MFYALSSPCAIVGNSKHFLTKIHRHLVSDILRHSNGLFRFPYPFKIQEFQFE